MPIIIDDVSAEIISDIQSKGDSHVNHLTSIQLLNLYIYKLELSYLSLH